MNEYENAIEIKGVTKKYDGFTLDDICVEPEELALIRLFFAKMNSGGGSKSFFLPEQ